MLKVTIMKKLILSVALVAFTVAVQAGEAKNCDAKPGCEKAACTKKAEVAKSCCPFVG